jgi:peptidoglycan L-alanyl-D-glutamate endopeptidase CwlK
MDLQALFYEVIKNYDCTILQGYRTEPEQEMAFHDGHTKLHWPNSKHNKQPAIAVDASPCPVQWDNDRLLHWWGGYVMGIHQRLREEGKVTHGLRWGGSWNGLGIMNSSSMLNDLTHFELVE